MSDLPKVYDPATTEARLYQWWEDSGFFHAEPDDPGEPFAIVIPPPNVTGRLHVGHALDNAIQDAFIRRARMQGFNAVWLPGTDHAGIATQNVVERKLAKEGLSRHDLGREAFLEQVWAWREESGGVILTQLRRLGASCDWAREVFTFDEQRSKAVREVFVTLYEQGLIYRGNRLINWCPRCRTALSEIEVDHKELDGELAYLRYPGADGGDGVVVATTRAETMLGDTAVAVHPDDERYQDLIGHTVLLPLMNRQIPVVVDSAVDPEFGTGAVKVTPAHDPNDYEIGQRHDLAVIDIMNDDATIADNGGPYAGLDRLEARRRVVADLDELGLLVDFQQRSHPVGVCSRCQTVIEPRLSDQWFVKVGPLAKRAAQAVRDGRTAFVPERNAKGFLDWLDNLHDWCISRQIWWGHRIPAWYDADGEVRVLREDPTPAEVAAEGLHQDEDVLDTWFSSQLWPFTTLGWPEQTPELAKWYPTTVLVTGYDINTFWVSRMLMIGLHFLDEVPFHAVVNHGLVRDAFGKKISKSFGNAIDPLELIDKYGADALRYALLRAATPGQDVPLAEEWVEGARRFANKLWNAARFVIAQLPTGATAFDRMDIAAADLALEDRWILSRLEAARAIAEEAYAAFDLARGSQALYHFVWDEFCDWYLELSKLRAEDPVVPAVLGHVLDSALRLLHPIVPFVTEELWRALWGADATTTLGRASWPVPAPSRRDLGIEDRFAVLADAVTQLRRLRADHEIPPRTKIDVVAVADQQHRAILADALDGITRLAGVAEFSFAATAPDDVAVTTIVLASGVELSIPLAGLVDTAAARERLEREAGKARAELARAHGKLANERFVTNAPPDLVTAEREKVAQWEEALGTLERQLAELG